MSEPLDLEAIGDHHQSAPHEDDICDWCMGPWPCDASQLVARVRELEAALARLVETEPTTLNHGAFTRVCTYCKAERNALAIRSSPLEHAPECPWRQARELIAP